MERRKRFLLVLLLVGTALQQYITQNETAFSPAALTSNAVYGEAETGCYSFSLQDGHWLKVFFLGVSDESLRLFGVRGEPLAQISTGRAMKVFSPAGASSMIIFQGPQTTGADKYSLQAHYETISAPVYTFKHTLSTLLPPDSLPESGQPVQNSSSVLLVSRRKSDDFFSLSKIDSSDFNASPVVLIPSTVTSALQQDCYLVTSESFAVHSCKNDAIQFVQLGSGQTASKSYDRSLIVVSRFVVRPTLLYAVGRRSAEYSVFCHADTSQLAALPFECRASTTTQEELHVFYLEAFDHVLVTYTHRDVGSASPLEMEIFANGPPGPAGPYQARVPLLKSASLLRSRLATGLLSFAHLDITEKFFGGVAVEQDGLLQTFQTFSLMDHKKKLEDKDYFRCGVWGSPLPECVQCKPGYYFAKDLPTKCLLKSEIPAGFGIQEFPGPALLKCRGCELCYEDWTCAQKPPVPVVDLMDALFDPMDSRLILTFREDLSDATFAKLSLKKVLQLPGQSCEDCYEPLNDRARLSRNKIAFLFSMNVTLVDQLVLFRPVREQVDLVNFAQDKDLQSLKTTLSVRPEDILVRKLTYFKSNLLTLAQGAIVLFAVFCKSWHVLVLKGLFYRKSLRLSIHFHSLVSTVSLLYAFNTMQNGLPDFIVRIFASYGYFGVYWQHSYTDRLDYLCDLPRPMRKAGLACNLFDNYWWNMISLGLLLGAWVFFAVLRRVFPVQKKEPASEQASKRLWSRVVALTELARKEAFTFEYVIGFYFGTAIEGLTYSFINIGYHYKSRTMGTGIFVSILFIVTHLAIIGGLVCFSLHKRKKAGSPQEAQPQGKFIAFLHKGLKDIYFRYATAEEWGSRLCLVESLHAVFLPLLTVALVRTKSTQPLMVALYHVVLIVLVVFYAKPFKSPVVLFSSVCSSFLMIVFCLFTALSWSVSNTKARYETVGILMAGSLVLLLSANILLSIYEVIVHLFASYASPAARSPQAQTHPRLPQIETEMLNQPPSSHRGSQFKLRPSGQKSSEKQRKADQENKEIEFNF